MDGDNDWRPRSGAERLHVLCRDPHTLWAYWVLQDETKALVARHFKTSWSSLCFEVRANDCTDVIFDGTNAHQEFRTVVVADSDSAYLYHLPAGRVFAVDLGLRLLSGQFLTLLRADSITTPRDHPDLDTGLRFGVLGVRSGRPVRLHHRVGDRIKRPYEETFDGYSVLEAGVKA